MNGRVPAVTGVVLGGSASVAANLAHAVYVQPHLSPVTVIGAVLWPLFTLIGFEVVVRPPWPTRGWRSLPWWLCRLAVIGVGVVAVVTSYEHMSGLLAYSGDNGFAVRYGPLAIDGLMVTSAAALLAIERFGKTAQATTPARVVQQSAPGPVTALSVPPAIAGTSPADAPAPSARDSQEVHPVPARASRMAKPPAPVPEGSRPRLPKLTDEEAVLIGERVLREADRPMNQAEYMSAFRAVRGGDTAVIKRSYALAREAAAKPQLVAIGG